MKNIKNFKISIGNYMNMEQFEFFGFTGDLKCNYIHTENMRRTNYFYIVPEEYKIELLKFCDENNYFEEIINSNPEEIKEGEGGFSLSILLEDGTTITRDVYENIPNNLMNFRELLKQIINNSTIMNLESMLIQLSIFYILATKQDDENPQLDDCANILINEIEMAKNESTLFYFEGIEHIVNKLSNNFTGMDKETYIELTNNTIAKINYFDEIEKKHHLMNLGSEKDVEQLADEILCFNMGFDELKEMPIFNAPAMYELGNRFYYANLYNEAYKYFQYAADRNFKKAIYMKILCMYNGEGVEKNQEQAFIDANELIKNEIHTGTIALIGEMYYFGNGTEQNYKKALEYFEEVEKEEKVAQYYLGMIYLNGYGVEKNIEKGIEYIIKSAKRKCKQAINYIIKENY